MSLTSVPASAAATTVRAAATWRAARALGGEPRTARVVRLAAVTGTTRLDDDGSAPRAGQRVVDCFLVFEPAPAAGAPAAAAWRVGQNVRVNFHE